MLAGKEGHRKKKYYAWQIVNNLHNGINIPAISIIELNMLWISIPISLYSKYMAMTVAMDKKKNSTSFH